MDRLRVRNYNFIQVFDSNRIRNNAIPCKFTTTNVDSTAFQGHTFKWKLKHKRWRDHFRKLVAHSNHNRTDYFCKRREIAFIFETERGVFAIKAPDDKAIRYQLRNNRKLTRQRWRLMLERVLLQIISTHTTSI